MDPELLYSADADTYGEGRRSLALRCRAGELTRVRDGVYIRTEAWQQLPVWDRERIRIRAAAEGGHIRRVLVQESAAVIWGLPVVLRSPGVLLLAAESSRGHRRGDLHWVERRLLEPLTVREGVAVTSRAQTVLDMAAYLTFDRALPALDHVLRPGQALNLPALDKETLRNLARKLPTEAKRRRALCVIECANPLSESAGESYSRAVLLRYGFPSPQLQHQFITPTGRFRTDFYWKEQGLAGEFDGAVKYGRGEKAPAPSWKTLTAEKEREDAIRATGTTFVRWSWADIALPPHDPRSLVQRLAYAGLPRSRVCRPLWDFPVA